MATEKDLKINTYFIDTANQNIATSTCEDVGTDDDFSGIKYYYDMLSGIGVSSNVIKSRNIRIYRKMPKDKKNYFIIAFPYFETTRIQINTSYKNADASWAERFFMGWKSGQKELGNLINQGADLIQTIVNMLGVNMDVKGVQSKLLEAAGGDSKAATGQNKGRNDYVKSFENTTINITEGLSGKETTILSSDSLMEMLTERIKGNYSKEDWMFHYDKFIECLDKHQPVRAYLFFLIDHLGGSVKITGEKNAVQLGQFGFDSTTSYETDPDTWDFKDKVMYAVCGDAYVVKNLLCTNLIIAPSNLLTPSGDYFSATISANFEPARLGVSRDISEWLTYRPVVGGKGGYFESDNNTEEF